HAGGYYILPQVFAKLLSQTFVQAHSTITSKNLHLITGGLLAHNINGSFSAGTAYAEEVFQKGPWDWMKAHYGRRYPWDGFGYHIYIDQGSTTTSQHILQYIDAIQAMKVKYSDSTPLWITEYGWSTNSVSEDVQAKNVETALGVFESRGDIA